MPPRDAVDLYLDTREGDLSRSTVENQRYRLKSFVEFCEDQDIDSIGDVTPN